MSLYHKHRPKTLDEVIGQEGAIASLQRLVETNRIPHAILLSGPSGCGKTTIARILKRHLQCGEQDFMEVNCADFKGIDTIRDMRRHSGLTPIAGKTRIWLIDEAHKLTNDAQNALLKILEDGSRLAYFMLATTDPQKLIKTIHTRCTEVRLSNLSPKALSALVSKVAEAEGMELSEDVQDEIVDAAEGSARKALVILEQAGCLNGDKAQMQAIQSASVNKDLGIALARALINPKSSWGDVAPILKELKDEPESTRYLVLGYCRSVLIGSKGPICERAFMIIDVFRDNFYDSKQAGLAAACWEAVHSGRR